MKTNIDTIQEVVDYIDIHLDKNLSLDSISSVARHEKRKKFSHKMQKCFCVFCGALQRGKLYAKLE